MSEEKKTDFPIQKVDPNTYWVMMDDDDYISRYHITRMFNPNLPMWRIKIKYWLNRFTRLFQ